MRLSNRPHRLRPALAVALALGLWSAAPPLAAQAVGTVRGTVTDAGTQRPLAGVQVSVPGTGRGALSNATGQYLIAGVPAGAHTVRAQMIGYTMAEQRVTVAEGQSATADFQLTQSAIALDEIVVTGTGAPTERRALGNAVATVSGAEVNQAPAAQSIDKALQGKIPGAVISQNNGQPGGGVSIRLRGTGSILGGAEPLIVIDGVIVENNSDALVSLGANATRGGAALTNSLSDIAPGDIERVEVIKGAAAAALYGSRANNGVIQIFTKRGQAGQPRVTYQVEGSIGTAPRRFALNESPVAGRGDVLYGGASAIGVPVTRYLYQDQLFRDADAITNQLSVTGGTEATSYYASAHWRNETGIIRGSSLSNASARASLTQRLSEWAEVGVSGNYIQRRGNYLPEGEQTEGVITALIFTPTTWNPAFNEATGRFPYNPLIGTNPFDVIENWRAEQDVNRFIGSFNAKLTPLPSVTVNYLFGLDRSSEAFTYYQPPLATGASFPGSIQNPVRTVHRFNNDLTATHEWDVSGALRATTTLGMRQTVDRSDEVRAAASGLAPGQTTVGGGGATPSASQGIVELRTLGGFVQERLALNDRLFLTGGLNMEASSAFGEDERWQFFPRLGASWVVSDEPFWGGSALMNAISTLRLRASYGQTGGQPPSAYTRFNNYVNTARGGKAGLYPSAIAGNPNLKPERQREYEAGFELGVVDNRASLDFTYYDQKTTDLVLSVPLALSSGFSSQLRNIGALSNKGVEIALNTVNIDRPGLTWSSRLSYAANRERVDRLVGTADTLLFGYLNYVIVGQPVGVFYGPYYPRDANGDIVLTGRLDAACRPIAGTEGLIASRARGENCTILRKILGSPTPDFTLAFSNELNLGEHLQFNVLLDGRFGNEVANFSRRISEYFGAGARNETEQCVTSGTVYCQYTLNIERHLLYEEFVEDGSFVKLREVSLRYGLPGAWARRVGADGLTVNLSGRNLYTWTDYSGIDPEVNLFSANTVARGVEFGTSPIPRVFALGLTVNF
jgi:TonB-linked SusC/RagA family outer membrane protein